MGLTVLLGMATLRKCRSASMAVHGTLQTPFNSGVTRRRSAFAVSLASLPEVNAWMSFAEASVL